MSEDYKLLQPDFTNIPIGTDCLFNGNPLKLDGTIHGYSRRTTYHGKATDGTLHFSNNNSGWGRSSTYTNFKVGDEMFTGGKRLVALNIKRNPKAGDFTGLPVGTIIREANTEKWWRIINNGGSAGIVISNCIDPRRFISDVNPNLGIRRCLKRHSNFRVSRDGDNYNPNIILPTCKEDVALARKFAEIYDTSNGRNLIENVTNYIHAINYKFGSSAESEETITAIAAYEKGSWDEFDNLCA